jgi:hypothetical protein
MAKAAPSSATPFSQMRITRPPPFWCLNAAVERNP